jgi:hypothetical protein
MFFLQIFYIIETNIQKKVQLFFLQIRGNSFERETFCPTFRPTFRPPVVGGDVIHGLEAITASSP